MWNRFLHATGRSADSKGFALMTAILFFMAGGTIILSGMANTVGGEIKTVRNESSSKQAYFTSESALEDTLYRIKTGRPYSSAGTLGMGSATATIAVATGSGSLKTVDSTGDKSGLVRLTEVMLDAGYGVSFPFAIQGGSTGIDLSSCSVTGDVFSAGSVRGTSACSISGMAIASGKTATSTDIDNEASISNPPSEIPFGDTYGTQDLAQSFTVSSSASLKDMSLVVRKIGNPSNVSVKVVTDDDGSPSTNVVTTGTISSSNTGSAYTQFLTIGFASNPVLASGTTYWVVLDANPNASNYYAAAATANSYGGKAVLGRYNGSWADVSNNQDIYLKTTIEKNEDGVTGVSAQNALVVGGAYAHTVKYVTSLGALYCQEGVSNNKACDTSRNDPDDQPFPVSSAAISEWKSAAAAGNFFSSDYTVDESGAALGPAKIDGNLTVGGGGTLSVGGIVWVTGNVSIADGSSVLPLDDSKSYAIVADGTISVSGGATVGGSAGHILLLSSNSADPAIYLAGGSHGAVLVAPNGGASVTGGGVVEAVAAKHVTMSGNAQATYDPSVSNLRITEGSSATVWSIKSWKETQ